MLERVTHRRLRIPETSVEIALLDWGGDGPLALLHHANGFCGAMWDEVAQALRPHFRVVALDARGHGDSTVLEGDEAYAWPTMARDLEAVAEHLLSERSESRVALGIGHSFGGTLTFTAGANRPGLFERILMVDPVIFPRADAPLSQLRTPDESLRERARRRRHVFESRAEARSYCESKPFFASWRPRALELYLEHGMRDRSDGRVELKCPGAVEGAIFGGAETLDVFERASVAKTPVHLLRAAKGNFPLAIYEAFAAASPADIDIEEVDAGHLVVMERPDLVAEAALRFAGLAK